MDEPGQAAPPGLDVLAALGEECALVSSAAAGLSEADFTRPTRCPAWNIKELLGHLYRDVDRINDALANPSAPAPDNDAVGYWRTYDPAPTSEDSLSVAQTAREIAGRHPTGPGLVAAWDEMWPRALDAASKEDRTRVVVTFGPALTLEEYLKTRVLEVTVHRMDLEDALGRRGWGTDTAVSIVDDIMVGLLGTEPPSALDWDVVDFIEAGAGRRELFELERKRLGRLAKRFPLMS